MHAHHINPASAPAGLTVAMARHLLHTRAISAVELLQHCLQRIAQVDPLIQACITVMADAALAQARTADAALAAGQVSGVLHGIPLGIKDLIATRGVRTTAGSQVLADWIPDEDATVVTRLTAAGAIALCKTNTHEFAFGTFTPPTRNPWNLACVPGGSSGGSAAAVATGECLAALGTDTGGSIRIPAACCGVTGLKPTYGLVSRAGILPLSWSLDHAGPIARTVADCALLLSVLAGYDPRDSDSCALALPDFTAALTAAERSPEEAVRGTRIGVPTNYFFRDIAPEVAAAIRAAIATYASLGAIRLSHHHAARSLHLSPRYGLVADTGRALYTCSARQPGAGSIRQRQRLHSRPADPPRLHQWHARAAAAG
jgi:aspartyl-tRNA(Asn)/glutamyl-tRNA(Gln) amidotransferase subunit A